MSENEQQRSPELDQVRRLLFPRLPAEEGWRRVEAALAGAGDEERTKRIEALATEDLAADLLAALRRLRETSPDR